MIKKITISTLLLGCSGLAIAEDVVSPQADTADIPATQMESMQIRATAVAKPAVPVNLPATSEGVTSKQIQDGINVINTEDAIKYLPSVQVRKRYIGDTNSPVSTRTSGTLVTSRTLVYADHVLLSNFLGNGASFAPRFWAGQPRRD